MALGAFFIFLYNSSLAVMTPESAHLTSQKGSNIIITAVVQQSARSLPANWVGEKLQMKLMESDQEKKAWKNIEQKK